MRLTLSRRTFLLGLSGTAALALNPRLTSANGFQLYSASEPRPPKRSQKHYFAFDTGIYAANKMQNMRLKMGEVKKDQRNPLFIDGINEDPPKRWEPRIDNGYPNVILDDKGIYHCYYTLFVVDPSVTNTPHAQRANQPYAASRDRQVGLAYARSTDGIHWEKPELGIVEFEGSKANNLLMRDVAGTGVLFEPNDPDPNKRFKVITRKQKERKLAVAFSADGIHFSELIEWKAYSPKIGADCHNAVFKDSRTNQYILTTRLWANNFRVLAISRSDDFINWSPLHEVLRGQGYEEQVYSMPVFEHHDIYFGFASIYKQGDNTQMDWDTVNLELYWSTNLTEWNKAVPDHNILIPAGAGRDKYLEGEFDSATLFAAQMTAGDNRLYYTGGKGRHRGWRDTGLGLAYIDKNRLAGMVARSPQKPMGFATNGLYFHGETLQIWADVIQDSSLHISINGKTGFEAENCQLEKLPSGAYRVSWKGQSLVQASKNEKRGISLNIVATNSIFWGLSGEFEMDESRYWRG